MDKFINVENSAKKLAFSLILVILLAYTFYGIINILKYTAPILLPLTLVYISSIILRVPYKVINGYLSRLLKFTVKNKKTKKSKNTISDERLENISSFISFWFIFILSMSIFAYVIFSFGKDFILQYKQLEGQILEAWPDIESNLKNHIPLIESLIDSFNIKEGVTMLLDGDLINNIVNIFKSVIYSVKDDTFSTVIAIVTWIVIPSFIYSIVTKPLKREHIRSIVPFSESGKNVAGDIFVSFRNSLETYFDRQIIVSITHFIILYAFFTYHKIDSALALAFIFGTLNLVPNLGSTFLVLASPILAALYGSYFYGMQMTIFIGLMLLFIDNIIFLSIFKASSLKKEGDSECIIVHPAIITFSIIFWGFVLNGILGLVLSIPITILIQVILNEYREKQL